MHVSGFEGFGGGEWQRETDMLGGGAPRCECQVEYEGMQRQRVVKAPASLSRSLEQNALASNGGARELGQPSARHNLRACTRQNAQ